MRTGNWNLCASNGVCVGTAHATEWGALLVLLLFALGFYMGRRI